jgi:hypothetical protein
VRRADAEAARELADCPDCFRLVAWNEIFYGNFEPLGQHVPWVDRLLGTEAADESDLREARSWNKRLLALLYTVADRMPWLVRLLPDPYLRNTVEEAGRYFENHHGLADEARDLLEAEILASYRAGAGICLIGHSLGSVLAFDTLWELSHLRGSRAPIELFVSLGSPLGTLYVRHRLLGAGAPVERRYPRNIERWFNVAAVGDHIALERDFAVDFARMLEAGLVAEILRPPGPVYNLYRGPEGLNPHRAYGYLAHRETGRAVAEWWRR